MIAGALILSMVLQLADAATTAWILRHGGVEKNPIVRWLIGRIGVSIALALKGVAVIGLLVWCWWTGFFEPVPWAAYFIAALSVAVVVHNLSVISRMRGR